MSALIWLSYASLLALGLLDNMRGPFFPDILNELHLNGESGSLFFAVTSFLAFVGSWGSHALARRRSALSLMIGSGLVLGVGYACIARAPSLPLLLIACALFGVAYGVLNLAQNLIVSESGPPHLRRRLFNGLHSMYGLSALLAPLLASGFRWFGWGWRQCFLSLAVLPVLLSLASLRFKAPPRKKVESSARMMNGSEWRSCFVFALMMACYLWGEISISTRLVQWLRDDLGFSPDRANFCLGGFFLTLLLGRILFSFVHFANIGNWLILSASAGLSSVVYLLGLHASPLWFVLCGLTMAPFFPMAMEQVALSFPQCGAQALGFVLGFGSLSIVLMHLVLGYCTDHYGLSAALHVAPVTLLTVALALVGFQLQWRGGMVESPPR